MMLLRKIGFWLVSLIGLGGVLGLGVAGYRLVYQEAGLKTQAEALLFACFLIAALLLIVAVSVVVAAKRNLYRAEALFSQRSVYAADSDLWKRRLGPLGELFLTYNKQIIGLNTRRALKIHGLSSLVRILTSHAEEPIVILDVKGVIRYVSANFAKKLESNPGKLLNESLTTLLPGIKIPHILSELDRSHIPVSGTGGGKTMQFTPVLDKRGEIAYVICTLGTKALEVRPLEHPAASQDPGDKAAAGQQPNRFWSLASRLLGGRTNKKG